jgi:hypothetical protein
MDAKTCPIINPLVLFGLLAFLGTPAFSCTCVSATMAPADFGAAVVFRGTVTARKPLAVLTEMRGRGRYAITFRVDEYWKGPRQPTVVVYGLDDGSDCLGGSGFEVRKDYLIFASEQPSQDVFLPGGTTLWYGWTDVVAKGTPMLVPKACAPSGETSKIFVMNALSRLGKGSPPIEAK